MKLGFVTVVWGVDASSNGGMTIPESFDSMYSGKPKKMNVAKKHQGKQRLLLNILQGQKTMVTKRWL